MLDSNPKTSYNGPMASRNSMAAVSSRIGQRAYGGGRETWMQPTGRIDAARAAEMLGFEEHTIPVLMSEGLLQPLGKPVQNAIKDFAAVYILALADDPAWLNKATQCLYDHWKMRNSNREKTEPLLQQT